MSFFIRNSKENGIPAKKSTKISGKRKAPVKKKFRQNKSNNVTIKVSAKNSSLDEEIPSDSEYSDDGQNVLDVRPSSDEEETVQEKRLRLAKLYLEEIEKEEKQRAEAKEVDREAIAHRLREDVLEQAGKLQKQVANNYVEISSSDIRILKGHRLSPTCLVLSPDDKYIYSAAKDCSIIKWCFSTGKRIKIIAGLRKNDIKKLGHSGKVMCLAISSDNKFLASGCDNKIINIWDPESLELYHSFKGHRDTVSGLVFRKGTHTLYSASHDRSVKVWNLDEMAYVETLFGHQDCISAIDALGRERAITSGGRDNTIRIWKIVEESQLIFNGHAGSIDSVRLINEENFISCSDDGSIAVWGVLKKKPLASVTAAHGVSSENGLPNWITSLAALQNTDLIASGSCDGNICMWKCGNQFRSLEKLFSIPADGFVNALQFTSDGNFLIAGVGQEHRLGRWWKLKKAKNALYIIPLNKRN